VRVLLVSPSFHGYAASIARGFEAAGHRVDTVLYDERSGFPSKLAGKFCIDLPERLGMDRTRTMTRHATDLVAEALRMRAPDAVVLVKGDTIDPDLWQPLRRRGIPVVLWLYDEVRRTRHSLDTLRAVDAVATYSYRDHQELSRHSLVTGYVPLAYDPQLHPAATRRSPDVVFIGARYPNREQIMTSLAAASLPVRAYGRDWSHRTVDRARTLRWRRPMVPGRPDVAREQAAAIMRDASAVLNIHGDQDGFNMRTFEACGVGGVQLIDRDDVSTLYEPDAEIVVFHSVQEIMELAARVAQDTRWADQIRCAARKRTLDHHTFTHRCAELLQLC